MRIWRVTSIDEGGSDGYCRAYFASQSQAQSHAAILTRDHDMELRNEHENTAEDGFCSWEHRAGPAPDPIVDFADITFSKHGIISLLTRWAP